ncbi:MULTISPECIES: sugar ABC transporter ATP-binding protein [unclassified Agarivorans]|uniref:sugar ABC transporter ATP-binding protein n=1 Tax=unclassified Agarivorans TaxID=2636026 RepID=UPI003D7EAAB6
MNQAVAVPPPLLSTKDITISFGGIKALDKVSLQVEAGHIHALLGENGAGKSTFIKVLTGVYQRDSGELYLNGKKINNKSVGDSQRTGISTVFQEVNLVPSMTVMENLTLQSQPRKWGLIDTHKAKRRAQEMLKVVGLSIDPNRLLGSFSVAIQQMIAIARALSFEAKLLILDEPTASLDKEEITRLFALMTQLKQKGIGIIFVTHFLDQVYQVCDRISVLRNGKHVGSFETKNLPREALIQHMVGHELGDLNRNHEHHDNCPKIFPKYIEIEGLAKHNVLSPVDLKVGRGEVVTLAGLLGSGRTELVELVYGVNHADSGKITLNNQAVTINTPKQAMQQRFGLCPEDRKHSGLIAELSVRENIIIALQSRQGWLKQITKAKQNQLVDEMVKGLHIATHDVERPVAELSGGNQQKVILARWLITEPNLLILDEPTRGIDVGAHHDIILLIRKLCEKGMSMLVVSSELEELVVFADRVLVMRDREMVAELSGEEINRSAIIEAIAQ